MKRWQKWNYLQLAGLSAVLLGSLAVSRWLPHPTFQFSVPNADAQVAKSVADPGAGFDLEDVISRPILDNTDPRQFPELPFSEPSEREEEKLRALGAEYQRLLQGAPDPRRTGVVEAPDDPMAPPRMDSGDPNPDRVRAHDLRPMAH